MTAPLDGELAPMEVAARADRLRAAMDVAEVPAVLLTSLTSIRYLTGFTGSAALLAVTAEGLTFVTDGRYGQQAEQQLGAAGVTASIEVSSIGQKELVIGALAGVPKVGLEAEAVTWAAQRTYAGSWFPDVELVPTTGLVAGLRLVKDDGEIARLERAASIADAALAVVRPRLAEGPTETEFGPRIFIAMFSAQPLHWPTRLHAAEIDESWKRRPADPMASACDSALAENVPDMRSGAKP